MISDHYFPELCPGGAGLGAWFGKNVGKESVTLYCARQIGVLDGARLSGDLHSWDLQDPELPSKLAKAWQTQQFTRTRHMPES